jgi:hypothetical protein
MRLAYVGDVHDYEKALVLHQSATELGAPAVGWCLNSSPAHLGHGQKRSFLARVPSNQLKSAFESVHKRIAADGPSLQALKLALPKLGRKNGHDAEGL